MEHSRVCRGHSALMYPCPVRSYLELLSQSKEDPGDPPRGGTSYLPDLFRSSEGFLDIQGMQRVGPIRSVRKPGDVQLERDIVRQGEPASGGVLKHLVAEPAQQTYDHHSACHLDRRLTAPAPGPSATDEIHAARVALVPQVSRVGVRAEAATIIHRRELLHPYPLFAEPLGNRGGIVNAMCVEDDLGAPDR